MSIFFSYAKAKKKTAVDAAMSDQMNVDVSVLDDSLTTQLKSNDAQRRVINLWCLELLSLILVSLKEKPSEGTSSFKLIFVSQSKITKSLYDSIRDMEKIKQKLNDQPSTSTPCTTTPCTTTSTPCTTTPCTTTTTTTPCTTTPSTECDCATKEIFSGLYDDPVNSENVEQKKCILFDGVEFNKNDKYDNDGYYMNSYNGIMAYICSFFSTLGAKILSCDNLYEVDINFYRYDTSHSVRDQVMRKFYRDLGGKSDNITIQSLDSLRTYTYAKDVILVQFLNFLDSVQGEDKEIYKKAGRLFLNKCFTWFYDSEKGLEAVLNMNMPTTYSEIKKVIEHNRLVCPTNSCALIAAGQCNKVRFFYHIYFLFLL